MLIRECKENESISLFACLCCLFAIRCASLFFFVCLCICLWIDLHFCVHLAVLVFYVFQHSPTISDHQISKAKFLLFKTYKVLKPYTRTSLGINSCCLTTNCLRNTMRTECAPAPGNLMRFLLAPSPTEFLTETKTWCDIWFPQYQRLV